MQLDTRDAALTSFDNRVAEGECAAIAERLVETARDRISGGPTEAIRRLLVEACRGLELERDRIVAVEGASERGSVPVLRTVAFGGSAGERDR